MIFWIAACTCLVLGPGLVVLFWEMILPTKAKNAPSAEDVYLNALKDYYVRGIWDLEAFEKHVDLRLRRTSAP